MRESPLPSLTDAHVVVVAGKGGVGKTTVTAVLARAAVAIGHTVLVVELDGKPTLDELLVGDASAGADADGDGDGAPTDGGGSIEVVHLSAPDALDEYLREHGFRRIAKRLNKTGVIDMVGTAAPGIDDVVVLGKVKQLERSGRHDLILVDGPAAGHAVTFLLSASGLADAARGGPVKRQADDVLELLGDGERCMVVLVTSPETTPVNETIETAYALEERVGVRLGPVVLNGVDAGVDLPDPDRVDAAVAALAAADGVDDRVATALGEAAAFRRSRRRVEDEARERLRSDLPLGLVELPAVPVAGLRAADVERLAAALLDGRGAAEDRDGDVAEG